MVAPRRVPVKMPQLNSPPSSMVVGVHGRKTIVPVLPSKLDIYPVSRLDSTLGNFCLHTVLYFDKTSQKPDLSWEMEMEELNFSLAQVLNLFPMLSGRLKVLENGSLGIKSNDAGIRLVEATSDCTLNDWLRDQGKSTKQQMFPEVRICDYSVSPLLALQYTKFRCGGAAIGLSWCHILADFMSMDLFLKVWGEAHRNFGNTSFHPSFPKETPANVQLPVPFPFAAHNRVDIKASVVEAHVFHFGSEAVEKLMHESGSAETEAVCALLWKSIARAQQEQQGDSAIQTSRLCLWMNTEGDKNHTDFGNSGTAFKFVDATAKDLQEQNIKDVAESIQLGTKLQNGATYHNVLFCNWAANFACYDTDFGFSGPTYVESSATSVLGEGIVTITQGCEGGRSKTVSVSLGPDAMKRLLQDSAFANATIKR